MLDPTQLPQFQVVVRVPPAWLAGGNHYYLPSVSVDVERMAVRFGSMDHIGFGLWNVTSGRGGVTVDYVSAENVSVVTGENAVRGMWNVSGSIYVNVTE
jgi:hypothetical protein